MAGYVNSLPVWRLGICFVRSLILLIILVLIAVTMVIVLSRHSYAIARVHLVQMPSRWQVAANVRPGQLTLAVRQPESVYC